MTPAWASNWQSRRRQEIQNNPSPYLLVFLIATTLAVCAGVWFYFLLSTPIRRVLSLIAGLILLMGIGVINSATLDWRAYYQLPENAYNFNPLGVALVTVMLALMYLTGSLSQKRQNSRNGPKGSELENGPFNPS